MYIVLLVSCGGLAVVSYLCWSALFRLVAQPQNADEISRVRAFLLLFGALFSMSVPLAVAAEVGLGVGHIGTLPVFAVLMSFAIAAGMTSSGYRFRYFVRLYRKKSGAKRVL